MNKLKVGIIGVGNIGFRYLEAVLDIKSIVKINLVEQEIITLEKRLEDFGNNLKKIHLL